MQGNPDTTCGWGNTHSHKRSFSLTHTHNTRVGSLIGSVEPVTRRILTVFPLAPLVVEGGILGAVFSELASLDKVGKHGSQILNKTQTLLLISPQDPETQRPEKLRSFKFKSQNLPVSSPPEAWIFGFKAEYLEDY
jgi:hypothetical protein